VRLHVHEWGSADAPPLLCLHGITSHGIRFRRLAQERFGDFRVIALDLRGHGHSDWEPPWDLETHVADVIETMDSLGLGRIDIIGHSFGGRTALELAARHPERVSRLVLYDPAVWVPPPVALRRAEEMRKDESFASIEEAVNARLVTDPKTPRAVLEEEVPEHLRLMDDGRWRYRYARAAVVAAYGEMAKPPPLAEVQAPTLLIRALGGEVVPEAFADMCRDAMPDCTVVTVPNGHIVMWEAFDETALETLRFLQDLRA
jgi:Predicted hydrolases or acyltransferases (alpha/beta hydrolase superfamily)